MKTSSVVSVHFLICIRSVQRSPPTNSNRFVGDQTNHLSRCTTHILDMLRSIDSLSFDHRPLRFETTKMKVFPKTNIRHQFLDHFWRKLSSILDHFSRLLMSQAISSHVRRTIEILGFEHFHLTISYPRQLVITRPATHSTIPT
jgi:hypothetical protein